MGAKLTCCLYEEVRVSAKQVLKVDNSGLTEDGGIATVTAWVDETGDLYAASGDSCTPVIVRHWPHCAL